MPIDLLRATDYTVARFLIERGLAVIYLVAFVVALRQFRPLLGEHGLLPVPAFVRYVPFRAAPSLFHVRYSDRLLVAVAWIGIAISVALVLDLPERAPLPVTMLAWGVLWALYLSIVNVGQLFYGYGWESLLLEAGFLAIFLGNDSTVPAWPLILLFRWLAFRVEFGAGLIKLRGDPCWRDLTCMYWHHETQPMPNPLSWYFQRLPKRWHRVEVAGNFAAQLAAPFLLFLPQPIAAIGAAVMILTQLFLVASGNYAWLNWVTIITIVAALPDAFFRAVLPIGAPAGAASAALTFPAWYAGLVLALAALIVVLSYWPVRNLLGSRQMMNASFNALHLVNTYGAFGSVTRERYEIEVEGTTDERPDDRTEWHAYGFKGKPGDPKRRPRQWAPYHLRLDWQMWFAALAPYEGERWFLRFVQRLLEADPSTLDLLRVDPFGGRRPAWVRALLYRYRYTSWDEHRRTGAWWDREPLGEYLSPVRLPSERQAAAADAGRSGPAPPRRRSAFSALDAPDRG